jgi:DNA-binding NarL/FixJ family response regulator
MGIRVAIAEDSLLVREGIEQLLIGEPEIDVVASCGDLPSLMQSVESRCPDVVVTDIRMPPTGTDEGIRAASLLRERHPEIGVVVLSQYQDPAYVLTLVRSGSDARAYLLKERIHDRGQLVGAIESVAHGGSLIDAKVVEVLVAARARGERSALRELTPRERQVLAEIAKGASNAAVAQRLVLSRRAVEKHINAIFLKLGLTGAQDVSKRVKAALLYLAERDGAELAE